MSEQETKKETVPLSVKKGIIAENEVIVLAGAGGTGKSTVAAASSQKALAFDTEKGTHWLDVDRIDCDSAEVLKTELKKFADQDHGYDTIIFDSWDRLCEMIENDIVKEAQKTKPHIKAIGDFDHGAGYTKATKQHSDLLDDIDRNLRGKFRIIVVCHVQTTTYKLDPTVEPYQKFALKMRDKMASRLREWSDFCLFANFDVATYKTGKGWDQRVVADGDPMKRWVHTSGTTYFDCKSRIPLLSEDGDPVFEFTWENIESAMKRGLKK